MNTTAISADFPFRSKYCEVLGANMHYVDEGQGDPILFLHGNPTSSYLWRNIIPYLTPFARCIAPDLIGMGRSDKPAIAYRFVDHYRYVEGFIEKMGLRNLTIVAHDWGSALGLYYAMQHEETIKGLALMEGILMPLTWDIFPSDAQDLFKVFRTANEGWNLIVNQNLFIEHILFSAGTLRELSEEEKARYRAPFNDPSDRMPIWQWPNELPIEGRPADVTAIVTAYNQWLQASSLPKLLLAADPGVLCQAPVVEWCRRSLTHLEIVSVGAGLHFIQEDNPNFIGDELARWYLRI
jgi:haloalkane dehalogenase